MAREQNLGTTEMWFVGEDKTIPFEIYSADEATMEDIAGWTIIWTLRRMLEGDAVLLTKTGTVAGSYNSDQAVNTQRVSIDIDAADTLYFEPGQYHHVLKRTDAGFVTVLAYGTVYLKRA